MGKASQYPARTLASVLGVDSLGRVGLATPAALGVGSGGGGSGGATTFPNGAAKTANFSIALTDVSTTIQVTNNQYTTVTATLNRESTTPLPIGSKLRIQRAGLGDVLLAIGTGVTIQGAPTWLYLRAQGSILELFKTGPDFWELDADMKAAADVNPGGGGGGGGGGGSHAPPTGIFRPAHGALIWQFDPATFQCTSSGTNQPADPKYNNLASPILMNVFLWGGREQTGNNEKGYYVSKDSHPGTTPWYIDGTTGNLIMQSQKLSDLGMANIVSGNSGISYAYTSCVIQAYFAHTMYGYFETVAKSSTARGTWPAFWLLPYPSGWPPEIDVFEHYRDGAGKQPGWITTETNHSPGGSNDWAITDLRAGTTQTASGTTTSSWGFGNIDLTTGQHVYGMDWRADHIDWYLDGVKIRSIANTTNQEMFPLWDQTVGGAAGNPDFSSGTPQMEISSISFYK